MLILTNIAVQFELSWRGGEESGAKLGVGGNKLMMCTSNKV